MSSMTSVAGSYGQSVGDQSLTVGVSAGALTVPTGAIGAMILMVRKLSASGGVLLLLRLLWGII